MTAAQSFAGGMPVSLSTVCRERRRGMPSPGASANSLYRMTMSYQILTELGGRSVWDVSRFTRLRGEGAKRDSRTDRQAHESKGGVVRRAVRRPIQSPQNLLCPGSGSSPTGRSPSVVEDVHLLLAFACGLPGPKLSVNRGQATTTTLTQGGASAQFLSGRTRCRCLVAAARLATVKYVLPVRATAIDRWR